MTQVNLNTLELNEFVGRQNAKQHCRATFPLIGMHGAKELATVYFEIAPGDHLGRHTDSAEELLVVLQGSLLAEIDGEKTQVSEGEIVLVPKMAPHRFDNIGGNTARVLGVFGGANNIIATFEKEWLPGTNVVDTSKLVAEAVDI